MDEMQKFHLSFWFWRVVTVVFIVVTSFLTVVIFYVGFDYVADDPSYFRWFQVLIIGGGEAFLPVIGIYALYRDIKWYLGLRTKKIPDVCPECKKCILYSDVKWIEEDKAQCPYCGVDLEVIRNWYG